MIEFRKAQGQDALTIVRTRQKAWNATYRGIYPDEAIDEFDYAWHWEMERRRLANPDFHCCLVMDGADCVGYFSYGKVRPGVWKDFSFRLHSLYILPPYQKAGLGKRIFLQIKEACLESGYGKMFLDCHPENRNALMFYQHMGGTIADMDAGHENPIEDTCTIEYYFQETP